MYLQIKNYAEENDMTIMGAIRYIIKDFFKKIKL